MSNMKNRFNNVSVPHLGLLTVCCLLWLSFNSPVQAHTIEPCYCDTGCYTEEVNNLTCTERKAKFNAKGLPHPSHDLMLGITASNQQFPSVHNYSFEINTNPKKNR